VPALLDAGWQVTAHRRSSPGAGPASSRLTELPGGDIPEDQPTATVDTVLHLAAIAHQSASPEDYRHVNVDMAVDLARRALARGVKRFVFVSSVKAEHAESAASRGTASLPLDYARSKLCAERALQALVSGQAMRLVILRPALVYGGAPRGHLAWLQRWVDAHLPRPPAGGARSMVARDDLVRLLLDVMDPRATPPPLVTLTDGEAYSTRRLHAALCRAQGRRPWLPSPPASVWRLACDTFDGLRRSPRGSTWQRIAGQELYPRRGLEDLRFQTRLTFEDSLRGGPWQS
jgi:UDP-glucose 4-epimerase